MYYWIFNIKQFLNGRVETGDVLLHLNKYCIITIKQEYKIMHLAYAMKHLPTLTEYYYFVFFTKTII